MGQRISRAKRKIRDARIPFRIPSPDDLPERLDAVRSVLYLVYTEGHTASGGPELADADLCAEAVRLGRLLVRLVPDDPETTGLLALMLLGESRRAARTGPDGGLVLLADHDRSLWDRTLIDEGQALVRRTLRWNRPGPCQIQAAIAAVHADAATIDDTDWAQIVALYDLLMASGPTPVVALHRAVALAEVDGPNAMHGPERLAHIAEATGVHKVVVRSYSDTAPRGEYRITVEGPRTPDTTDRIRVDAQTRLIEGQQLWSSL